ncbi:PEP-CTERM sorting domain-containing protein [Alishewanella sp. 16-MA]|uniref:PEP-CTERM sorting domain-containing protein n=1 Tax=Alishewanella maricola TaxID=2795740 RepID=A0ABS8C1Z2_9ALTE|nr:PEP-CTERM sorting domain-containing protein [Alishewanella maricola]MCB5226352.1 PEP-CTERM sorting domain-containing protein [Alishewanella maricola]
MRLIKYLIAAIAISGSTASNAAIITVQGSNVLNNGVTMSVTEARSAWEALLFSHTLDTIIGATGTGANGITTTAGNVYKNIGNGSSISISNSSALGSGPAIGGSRNGASRISFDVFFTSPVNAVAFDVYDNDGGGMQLILTDANTGLETLFDFNSTLGSGHSEFFGVVFDPTTFVSSLRVGGTDPGGVTTWDNFSFGIGQQAVDSCTLNPNQPQCTNVSVSEPVSLALFGFGLAGLALRRRIKK